MATVSLLVNVVPFSGQKTLLATLIHAFIPKMNCLVMEMSRHSYEPCTSHSCDNSLLSITAYKLVLQEVGKLNK